MNTRRVTRQFSLGNEHTGIVKIGGDAPVSVQTMTAGYTWDIDACVAEVNKLSDAGADVVRVAVPQRKDTEALPEILNQTRVPIVADVHFHYKRALEAVDLLASAAATLGGSQGELQAFLTHGAR